MAEDSCVFAVVPDVPSVVCTSQLLLWMWTGRTTLPLPPAALTCAFMYADLAVIVPLKPFKDTQ